MYFAVVCSALMVLWDQLPTEIACADRLRGRRGIDLKG